MRPEAKKPGGRDGRASRHRTGTWGSRGEPGATAGPQQGLGIQIQIHQRSSRWPAGANLACCPSPNLKSYAGVQPVKDNLGRSDVAFARNGFAEGAQNGQRVGMRSPVGAPDDWTVLESSLISSSSYQAYCPLAVRQLRRVWELILKIFFDAPEMNCSIFFSMHFL